LVYPPLEAGGDVARCGVSLGIVRKGLGKGEVNAEGIFLWLLRWIFNFSAVDEENNSIKQSLRINCRSKR
jgi:hypothetical protein